MRSSFRGPIVRRLSVLFIASAVAVALLVAPGTSRTATANVNLNCGIRASYMCIYLSIGGDGNGEVTFTSYTLLGATHTISNGSCIRSGGTTTGYCVFGFSYLARARPP